MDPLRTSAIAAARVAAVLIRGAAAAPGALQMREKQPNDFVTEVDLASERSIVAALLAQYPDHGVRTEESARVHGDANASHLWIVDPLDGTTNFIHGYPNYAVSIALAIHGRIDHGVVLDVCTGDVFHASRGQGAWRNGAPLRVSERPTLAAAVLATSCPARAAPEPARAIAMFTDMMGRVAALRRSGSAALDMARVAAGQCDGAFDQGLNAWDVAAGSLLITEAGGRIGNFLGAPEFLDAREYMAAGPGLFEAMGPVLRSYSRFAAPPVRDQR
ncbi:MAG: inositol monophosphatase family protein [Betaproteobacteria bacterium]